MCGRYVQVSSPTLLVEHFDVDEIGDPRAPDADYNVAPRAEVLTVVQRGLDDPETAAEGGIRVLEPMRWGLVPSWADDLKIGDRMINARAESIAEKPAFKTAFRKRRCIIPADGFYEWQTAHGHKKKQPMFIHRRDGEPIAFAGLWEVWQDPRRRRAVAAVVRDRDDTRERDDGADPRPHAGDPRRGRVGHVARRAHPRRRRARAAARSARPTICSRSGR